MRIFFNLLTQHITQMIKMMPFAEEAGQIGGNGIHQIANLPLRRIRPQNAAIGPETIEPLCTQPADKTRIDHVFFLNRQDNPRFLGRKLRQELEFSIRKRKFARGLRGR